MGRPKGSKNKPKELSRDGEVPKSLTQALQDLVSFIYADNGEECHLEIKLPEKTYHNFNKFALPKQRIVLYGEITGPQVYLSKLHLQGGTVTFLKPETKGELNGTT